MGFRFLIRIDRQISLCYIVADSHFLINRLSGFVRTYVKDLAIFYFSNCGLHHPFSKLVQVC